MVRALDRAFYRTLSFIYAWLPASARRKEGMKAFVYRNWAGLFRRSPNYGHWLRANPPSRALAPRPPPLEPGDEMWLELKAKPRETSSLSIYVVVPVYRGRAETLACLYSVRRSSPDARLVVIDDASPDAGLSAKLSELAGDGHFELLRNETNQGFLRSVNLGIEFDPTSDVVLLNSDTEVYGDWLSRLREAAYREADIGTVTPLSNNGDITSYPRPNQDNVHALELDFSAIDRLAATVNRREILDTPTGVGFCLYIRRDCLAETGPFDPLFVDGYGEENDFCLRAREAGWRSVIATDVFVRHVGAVSFGSRATRLRSAALALLLERHPDYLTQVDDFLASDPTRDARLRLDAARLRRRRTVESPKHSVLFVAHEWGGGIERHLLDLAARLAEDQVAVYCLRPRSGVEPARLVLSGAPGAAPIEELATASDLPPDPLSSWISALRVLEIDHVHVHHIGELGTEGPRWLMRLCAALGVPFDVTIHDYVPICPRIHLAKSDGRYCGEPDATGCGRCLEANGSRFGRPDPLVWQADWRAMLRAARRVVCPSEDVRARIAARWPEPRYVVLPHPESARHTERRGRAMPPPSRATPKAERLRVLVPGAVDEQKGIELLIACAEDARERCLPLDFWIVGYSSADDRAARAGIEITGRYALDDAEEILASVSTGVDVAFLPSLAPETWSYTLSSVLSVGLRPVAFDLGALAERIGGIERGRVIPLELSHRPAAVNDILVEMLRSEDCGVDPTSRLPEMSYSSILVDYYGGIGSASSVEFVPEGRGTPVILDRDGVINRDSPTDTRAVEP